MPGSISALAQEMLARELRDRPAQFREAPKFDLGLPEGVDVQPLNPEVAAGIGGAADALSTYSFLKRGTGVEENAAWAGAKNSPGKTAASVAGSAAAMMAARAMLRRFGMGRIADMMAGVQGSHQMGLAAQNAQYDSAGGFPAGSEHVVRTKVQTAMKRQ